MNLKQTEPIVEKVGGRKYYIRPFPAFKAANLTGELAAVLAPLVGALVPLFDSVEGGDGEKAQMSLGDIDANKAASAIANCAALDGTKLELLTRKLLLGGHIATEIENDRGELEPVRLDEDIVDEVFCGDVQDLFLLCFYVIRLNFNGFFKRLATQSGGGELAEVKKVRPIL